jgi:hypothetical protein
MIALRALAPIRALIERILGLPNLLLNNKLWCILLVVNLLVYKQGGLFRIRPTNEFKYCFQYCTEMR